jgi:hypothetical protein
MSVTFGRVLSRIALWGAMALVMLVTFGAGQALGDELYGKIRGTVTDQSGAIVPGAEVTVTNTASGTSRSMPTTASGDYEFVNLIAPGLYNVDVTKEGFRKFESTNIHLGINQVYIANVALEVGSPTQTVVVEANVAQINTTEMQLGATVTGSSIVDLPLNGRNWIQLQQLQPGVVGGSDRFTGTNYSTNGAETQQNAFYVNGVDTADISLNVAAIIPSADAIGEFHLVTSTINPEFGRNSGAIMNAVIKNGTNAFHGSVFEFYRDTFLDARSFFQPSTQPFQQNMFGGTIGGPVLFPHLYNGKNKTFFFFSYQGTRNVIPVAYGVPTVYSTQERSGDFSDLPSYYNANNPEPAGSPCGSGYTGPFGPNTLPYAMGSAAAGTPYCVAFPTGNLSGAGVSLNSLATKLLNQYVPTANAASNTYTFNPDQTTLDDQYITRIDQNFGNNDSIWGYWLWERQPTTDTLPFDGASLPGFAQIDKLHDQQYAVSWTHTFTPTTVNEARFGYLRYNFNAVNPVTPINPTAYGFTGITAQNPAVASLPVMAVVGMFNLGFSLYGPQPRLENTYQAIDNFSKILGKHSIKAGFTTDRFQVYNPFYAENSGYFAYAGAGSFSTGAPGTDFLLGLPDEYVQGSGSIINARAREFYSYIQDEYKVRPNITLTFGTGWDVETPYLNLYFNGRMVNAFRPGQQSTVFPTAPTGVLWPGDAGINSAGGVSTPLHDFAPRLGIAWSPGDSHKMSVHAGVGIYYNRTEEEIALQNLSTPPFTLTSIGVGSVGGSPNFATPFSGYCAVSTPCSAPNPFPYTAPAAGSAVNFSSMEPMTINTLSPNFGVPASYNYNVTFERQLSADTTLTAAYVGNVGRHLEGNYELNPAGVAPGSNPVAAAANCNPANVGTCAPQTFRYNPLTTGLGAINEQATDFNSRYNSLQVSVNKRLSHGLSFLAAYTWSRFFDQNSSADLQDGFQQPGINPFDLESMWAPSDNDAPQRFVFSYDYALPIYHFVPHVRRLTDGWKLVGITTFQHGFPLLVANTADPSDTCWSAVEFDDVPCWDRPNRVSGVSPAIGNPRNYVIGGNSNYWFNPAAFASAAAGTSVGNSSRNPIYGPGINNFDLALYKDIHITEAKYFQLRFETYNTFNHTQFTTGSYQPNNNIGGVVSDINDPRFGRVIDANLGRVIQLGGKFYF